MLKSKKQKARRELRLFKSRRDADPCKDRDTTNQKWSDIVCLQTQGDMVMTQKSQNRAHRSHLLLGVSGL